MMVTHSIQEAVTMSDRIIVLTGRPARLLEQVEIGSARPRAPEDSVSGPIISRIRSMIRGAR
jgi:NitT/TauT family transport system ATP-binding protein